MDWTFDDTANVDLSFLENVDLDGEPGSKSNPILVTYAEYSENIETKGCTIPDHKPGTILSIVRIVGETVEGGKKYLDVEGFAYGPTSHESVFDGYVAQNGDEVGFNFYSDHIWIYGTEMPEDLPERAEILYLDWLPEEWVPAKMKLQWEARKTL
ncbi:hypothetical protein CAC42_1049 [Sphaceloma murrayae]|uniref:Uncharacterized protein n=1 Tax=Sphaceloma murrayae TaxID=2082308 RepID=A0A2K1R1Y3_9PEZI|nr:hypothetical protein CAC42_1049 [Sphaceloma murrayae]